MVKSLNFKRIVLEGIILLLLYWIGKEWIATLPYFTDTETDMLYLFTWPLLIILLIHRVIPWRWVRFGTALLFVVIWYQQTLWSDVSFFSYAWIRETMTMLGESGFAILRMDWYDVDPILRTGLFYLLIWSVSYLMYAYVMVQRKVLGVLIVSICYFSTLDTFFLFDGKWPIIKALLFGFSLLALVNLNRVEGQINRRVTQLTLGPWFMTTLTILIVIGTIGYVAPKGDANWPDPVSFLTTLKGDDVTTGGVGMAQSGYSYDDSRLGGSFEPTDNVIMEGIVTGERYPPHYWRGEAKEVYTGHGWETNLTTKLNFQFHQTNPFTLINTTDYTEVVEEVRFYEPSNLIFTSGQLVHVKPQLLAGQDDGEEIIDVAATINPDTHRIEASDQFGIYVTKSFIPKITEQVLIDITDEYDNSTENYPAEIMEIYTQLPDTLPERVGRLAKGIMGDEPNIYKRIKRIETYLRWSGFQYRTKDIPYPEEGQDFVDQFLFDTRKGYCDHFSTAMVVLLRSQGIPARWVKGYTFGDVESRTPDTHFVTVRGKNAHSWVEVYFPEVGWVPFEPTASFNNPLELIRAVADVELPEQKDTRSINDLLQEEREKELLEQSAAGAGTTKGNWIPWVFLGLVLMLGGVLTYFFRETIKFRIQELTLNRASGTTFITKGYQIVLRALSKMFGVREESETVREYTDKLFDKESRIAMNQLTKAFEETRYGEKEPSISKVDFIAIWKRLLKKLRT